MSTLKAFYTTEDLKIRYNRRATRTLKEWQEKKGMPKPVPFSQGGCNLIQRMQFTSGKKITVWV